MTKVWSFILAGLGFIAIMWRVLVHGKKSGKNKAENKQLRKNQEARKDDAKIRDDVNRTDVDDLRDELRKQSKR